MILNGKSECCFDLKFQAEWGFVYAGEVLVSAVDENGDYQVDKLNVGDIWYFPKGSAHTVQGENHRYPTQMFY